MEYLARLDGQANQARKDHQDPLVQGENLEFLERLDCQGFRVKGDFLGYL